MEPSEQLKQGMASILGELETLYAQDKIGAVQINIALRDGNVRTLKAYDSGFRVLLVAAAAIGQREAFETTEVTREEHWRAPDRPVPSAEYTTWCHKHDYRLPCPECDDTAPSERK